MRNHHEVTRLITEPRNEDSAVAGAAALCCLDATVGICQCAVPILTSPTISRKIQQLHVEEHLNLCHLFLDPPKPQARGP